MIKFKSFSSGSCGNCYWLGIENDGRIEEGILIDAGVSLRRVRICLQQDGLSLNDFSDILVTHDHFDHIRSLGSYCKHLQRPVWTTATLHEALSHHVMTYEYIPSCRHILREDAWNDLCGGRIRVRCFTVPHDATQTVGFAITLDGYRYVHITDCGRMTEEALGFCAQADTVVLESNYDPEMLEHGHYPPELQARIRGGNGHMSNEECAAAISSFAHKNLRNVFLCHLSENNNTPELAYQASRPSVPEGVRLQTLPRQTPSVLFNL
ncbi:MAG: MBL fold metallo-hydrolase [Bacteroidales bacterium]|nr:MBL fold metallo-hydrolase [Bacteroidales bacterium]